jgi:hypothetical protein
MVNVADIEYALNHIEQICRELGQY